MSESLDPLHSAGSRPASYAGYLVALVGVALILVDARAQWANGQTYVLTESLQIPFTIIGMSLVAVGIAAAVAFFWFPTEKKLVWKPLVGERLAEAHVLNSMLFAAGAFLLPAGGLVAAALYHFDLTNIRGLLAVCAASSALGLLLLTWGLGRHGLLRRLLAGPVAVSSVDESEGDEDAAEEAEENAELAEATLTPQPTESAAKDPRLAIVLPALDQLLETISEEALATFQGTQAAEMYLELIDELGE